MTGLLDARGAEIASYTYDAWGNVITDTEKSFCYEGYEVPFELNHVNGQWQPLVLLQDGF